MKYVLDTHALVWYFVKDRRMSSRAMAAVSRVEKGEGEIIIPSIVLLEALDIGEKRKVKFDVGALFEFLESAPGFSVFALDFGLVREGMGNSSNGLDLHDRIIVTVARLCDAAIITRDSEIKRVVRTIW